MNSFLANRTLDPKSGDKKTFVDLMPSEEVKPKGAGQKGPVQSQNPQEPKKQQQQKESKDKITVQMAQKDSKGKVKYSVLVKTGNKLAAGTDSNVTLIIYGSKGTSPPIALNSSISTNAKANLFEKGNLDEFEIELNDLGKVSN